MSRFRSYLITAILCVVPLIFLTDTTRNPYAIQIALLPALVLVLWMAWAGSSLRAGAVMLLRTPIDIPLAVFLCIATASWACALAVNARTPHFFSAVLSEGFKGWQFLVINVILSFYIPVYLVSESRRRSVLMMVLGTGTFAAAYGVLQYFGIEPFWPRVLDPFGGRSVSTFGNPTFLSSYLVLLMPVALAEYIRSRGAARAGYGVLWIVFAAGLLCTLTRSSWLGAAVAAAGTLALFAWFERQALRAALTALIVLFFLTFLIAAAWPRSVVTGYNPSVQERLFEVRQAATVPYAPWHQRMLIWSCAWSMVSEYPVLGRGWGCFELFYPLYQGRHIFLERFRLFRTHANNAHNELLEISSQTGIAGLGVFLWLMVSLGFTSARVITTRAGRDRVVAIGLSAGLAGMLADNLFNVSLHFVVPAFLFWWNAGMVASYARAPAIEIPARRPLARAVLITFIALSALLVIRLGMVFAAEVDSFSGAKLVKDDPRAALPYLERAQKLNAREVNSTYELANAYARLGLSERALRTYDAALDNNAGYDEIYYNRATVLYQAGKVLPAIADFSRSLAINPFSAETYAVLGSIMLKDPAVFSDAALALFNQALIFFPENKDMWNNVGFLYAQKKRSAEAAAAFRRALAIDPDFETARVNYAMLRRATGTRDRAQDESMALRASLEGHIAAGDWQAARVSAERLVALEPASVTARLFLGNVLFTLGRLREAVDQYTAVIDRVPDHTAGRANRAAAYLRLRDGGRASADINRVLEKEPGNTQVLRMRDYLNGMKNQK